MRPEYKVVDGWADYALLLPEDSPAAIIEAKKLGTIFDDKIRHQMLTYATFVGIKYAGLTDSDHWELYEVLRPGPLKERRALKTSIATAAAHECALKLLLLWRPNLTSGEPVPANRPILVDPPPPIKPDPPPTPTATTNWIALSEYDPLSKKPSPPVAIRFWDESEQTLKRWHEVATSVIEKLYAKRLLTVEDIPIRSGPARYVLNTESVHPIGNDFSHPKPIEGTPLIYEAKRAHGDTLKVSKQLLERFGRNPASVYVRVAQ